MKRSFRFGSGRAGEAAQLRREAADERHGLGIGGTPLQDLHGGARVVAAVLVVVVCGWVPGLGKWCRWSVDGELVVFVVAAGGRGDALGWW